MLSKEELDRIFEKQARYEAANEEQAEKEYEERLKARWIKERRGPREFPNDALAKETPPACARTRKIRRRAYDF